MRALAVPLLLSLATCDDQRPSVPTTEEAARLDEADAMLNDAAANEQDSRR